MAARVRCAWVARRSVPVTHSSCTQCSLALNAERREVPHEGCEPGTEAPYAARLAKICWAMSKSAAKAPTQLGCTKRNRMIPRFQHHRKDRRRPFVSNLDTDTPFSTQTVLRHPDKQRTRRGSMKVTQRLWAELQNLCPPITPGGGPHSPRRPRSRRPWDRSCWWDRGAGRARYR